MNIGEKLKNIRQENGLTQLAFAKKFFVKENTISNYEKNLRSPSVEFLSQVCKEFGLSLDYFEAKDNHESNPHDLIITKKYGKLAIFDTNQSYYLTPHIYENIALSPAGYHLVFARGKDGEITYSAMVDNFGKVKEYPNVLLGNNGGFDRFGNIVGYDKESKSIVLMNANGQILCKGYNRIHKINSTLFLDENVDYGIYFGLKTNTNNELEIVDMLDKNGHKIDLTLNKTMKGTYEIAELLQIENIIKNIDKYGIAMIYFIPEDVFEKEEAYTYLVDYFIDKILKSNKENIFYNIANCVEFCKFLKKYVDIFNMQLSSDYFNKIYQIEDYIHSIISNKIECENLINVLSESLISIIKIDFF